MPTYLSDGETPWGFIFWWGLRALVALVVFMTLLAIYNAPGCGPIGHERDVHGTVRSATAKSICIEGDGFLVEVPGSLNCYALKLSAGQTPPKPGQRISAHLSRPLPAMHWRVVSYSVSG
jgi:hypothetical protein